MLNATLRYLGQPLYLFKRNDILYSVEMNQLVKYRKIDITNTDETLSQQKIISFDSGVNAIYNDDYVYILTIDRLIMYGFLHQKIFRIKFENYIISTQSYIILLDQQNIQVITYEKCLQINLSNGSQIIENKFWPIKLQKDIYCNISGKQLLVYAKKHNIIEKHNVHIENFLLFQDNLILFQTNNVIYSYNLVDRQTKFIKNDQRNAIIYDQYVLFYERDNLQLIHLAQLSENDSNNLVDTNIILSKFYQKQISMNKNLYIQQFQQIKQRRSLISNLVNLGLEYFDNRFSLNIIQQFLEDNISDLIQQYIGSQGKIHLGTLMKYNQDFYVAQNVQLQTENYTIDNVLRFQEEIYIVCQEYGQNFFVIL